MSDSLTDILDTDIQNALSAVEDCIVTAWVVVAELSTPDGTRWHRTVASPNTTQWLRDGMLEHGKSHVIQLDDTE